MRKKQIEAIAQAVKDARDALTISEGDFVGHPLPASTNNIFDSVARSLADAIGSETARFQRSKFLAQCGVERP